MARCDKCGAETSDGGERDRKQWGSEFECAGSLGLGVPEGAVLCEACRRDALMLGAAVLGQTREPRP